MAKRLYIVNQFKSKNSENITNRVDRFDTKPTTKPLVITRNPPATNEARQHRS
jgi:hypothetical protein